VKFKQLFLFYLFVFPISAFAQWPIIDTATVGSERNYNIIGTPNASYIWGVDNAFITSNASLPNIRVLWNEPTGLRPIWVIEENQIGCQSDTIKAFVYVSDTETLHMPNAFTPNGDGLNDVFSPITSPKNIKNYHLKIYNRWGIVVFESNNLEQGWDGTYAGNYCETGIYIWHLLLEKNNGKTWSDKGTVNIIR